MRINPISLRGIAPSDPGRLASGRRIVKPSDDPAGLAVAVELSAQAGRQQIASRNVSDGFSVSSIIQGVLGSVSDINGRRQELAAQAANGTLSDAQRDALNKEYKALGEEIDRTTASATFNGKALFGQGSIDIQAGASGEPGDTISIALHDVSTKSLGLPADISTQDGARLALEASRSAAQQIAGFNADVGASTSRLVEAFGTLSAGRVANEAAAGQILDADYASEVSTNISQNIRAQAGAALGAQANVDAQVALRLL